MRLHVAGRAITGFHLGLKVLARWCEHFFTVKLDPTSTKRNARAGTLAHPHPREHFCMQWEEKRENSGFIELSLRIARAEATISQRRQKSGAVQLSCSNE